MAAGPLPSRGTLMTSIAELYALQEVDLELASDRESLEDVRSRLGDSDELEAAKAEADEKDAALRVAEKQFKEQEFEADELRKKIEPVEQKLYTGKVTIPKELADLQKELESLKRRQSELEDNALEAMDGQEQAQQAAAQAQQDVKSLDASYLAEQEELGQQQTNLESNIAALEGQRNEQAEQIDADMLRLYDRLVAIRQGRAVAKVHGGACQGCRISLPQNVLQRARSRGNLVQCSSCERILYVS